MTEKASEGIMKRAASLLIAVLTVATGAALAYWGPTVPMKITGAERAIRGLEEIHKALQKRKAKVNRRKKPRMRVKR